MLYPMLRLVVLVLLHHRRTKLSGISSIDENTDISVNNINLHGNIISDNSVKTITVTVASKTANHPENGNGSSSGYWLDGVESPELELVRGMTYKFDQADSTNSGHPFRFYTDKNKNTSYSTGVTTNGTAGSSGAYSQIKVAYNAPNEIFYQCSAHNLMGHKFKIVSKSVFNDISANDVNFNTVNTGLLTVGESVYDTGGTTSMSILAPGENAYAILYFGANREMSRPSKAALISEGMVNWAGVNYTFV